MKGFSKSKSKDFICKTVLMIFAAATIVGCSGREQTPDGAVESASLSDKSIPGQFIVTLSEDASPDDVAIDHGIQPKHVYRSALNGFAGSISEAARLGLLGDERVLGIEPDQIVSASTIQVGATWGLDRLDQRTLPLDSSFSFGPTGLGVTAYIIDTGIRLDHSEFSGRASFGFDAFGGAGADCNGHGTHVSGTVGGLTYGVAKNVNLVAVRVLDCNGSGSTSGVIAGVDWVTKYHASPAVANLSLGGGASFALDSAVQKMIFSGVATAVAAGNENKDACNSSPARVSDAMTVGASAANDARASWSNYGKCVDWFAPGVSITSAWFSTTSATNTISGTSMASPHTAGVAALYLEGHPTDLPARVRDSLLGFATKGVITASNTSNNHLLYAFEFGDGAGDYVSPIAAISSPANGTVAARRSLVTIQVAASDNVGIQKVEIYANGSLICTDTVAPYACVWKAANLKGAYLIQAKSFDSAGNVGSSPFITVNVN